MTSGDGGRTMHVKLTEDLVHHLGVLACTSSTAQSDVLAHCSTRAHKNTANPVSNAPRGLTASHSFPPSTVLSLTGVEERRDCVHGSLVSSDHDGQTSLARTNVAAADGRVQSADPACGGGLVDLAGQRGLRGRLKSSSAQRVHISQPSTRLIALISLCCRPHE